jgi:Ni/Fe-hydrogenase 1 B-type cytochrome subunit
MAQQQQKHPLFFRFLHQIILVSILFLILTGYYIHTPFDAAGGFLMSLVRGTHFLFAALLTGAVVVRIVAMFVGRNRDWRSFLPSWSDLKKLPAVISYYMYLGKEPEIVKKYNPLQMITYTLVFVMILFQILSGAALLWPDTAFRWFNYSLFNNEVASRMAHFIVTWLFISYLMVHVYMGIREKSSEIRIMLLPSLRQD